MNAAVKKYLHEHLLEEKSRAWTTVRNYQNVHDKRFAPEIGGRRVRDVAVGVNWCRFAGFPRKLLLTVDLAFDGKTVKPTKTHRTWDVSVTAETMDMLLRHCELMDERAATAGVKIAPDAFVFSRKPDCSEPTMNRNVAIQYPPLVAPRCRRRNGSRPKGVDETVGLGQALLW